MPHHAVIIDLASSPGGTDFRFAEKRGIKATAGSRASWYRCPENRRTNIGQMFGSTLVRDREETEGSGMNWKGIQVGFALTGSHCTFDEVMPEIRKFVDAGAIVTPIISYR